MTSVPGKGLEFELTGLVHTKCGGRVEKAREPYAMTYCTVCQVTISSRDAIDPGEALGPARSGQTPPAPATHRGQAEERTG